MQRRHLLALLGTSLLAGTGHTQNTPSGPALPLGTAINRAGRCVLWCCDPMHGNTETTRSGIKTRRFEKILQELEAACRILQDCGAHLGGVHFELTGDNVTECLGGASGVTEADLTRDYRTALDPRLNYEQSMEMALLLARLLSPRRKP